MIREPYEMHERCQILKLKLFYFNFKTENHLSTTVDAPFWYLWYNMHEKLWNKIYKLIYCICSKIWN